MAWWKACPAVVTLLLAAGCSSSSDDGAGAAAGQGSGLDDAEHVVFNEFSSTGATEWLELANGAGKAFDLSAYAVADTDKDTGLPKAGHAMRFPAGTTIEAGGHILILTDKDDSEPGPYLQADCLPAVAVTCFYATFGVSASSGEAVHLLAPDDAVVTSTSYPTSVAPESGSLATVCRLPDMTGDFAPCTATPGAVNEAW